MRTLLTLLGSAAALVLLAAQNEPANLTITLVDADGGAARPGVVRVLDAQGNAIPLAGLLNRGEGLKDPAALRSWSVVVGPAKVSVPRGRIIVEAFSGLETELARMPLDVTGDAEVAVPLRRFSNLASQGWRSANTHLHLRDFDRPTADRYLTEVPAADDLDVLFISHLERTSENDKYISNEYPVGDLKQFSRSRVLVNNGEEHRNNFGPYEEGYGHVMLLGIRELIQPVSIGPGITQQGTDGIPMAAGIDNAHAQQGRAIWCHNEWGLEDIPNWVAGRLDAQNIFDGSIRSTYTDSFYRYLNVGLKVPFSTGTDWFAYDLSRAYVQTHGSLTVDSWLQALSQGRSFITNGPLVEFSVEGRGIGDTVELDTPRAVRVEGVVRGRVNFGQVELVRNGVPAFQIPAAPVSGHYEARVNEMVELDEPCWLALRIPPPPLPDDKVGQEEHPRNEFGAHVFAHTSPIYVTLAGRSVFMADEARRLLADMEAAKQTILQKATFANDAERQRVLAVYDQGIASLKQALLAKTIHSQ